MVWPQDVQYLRTAIPQRLDQQRALPLRNRMRTTKTDYSASGASFFPAAKRTSQCRRAAHMHRADPAPRSLLSVTLPGNLAFANNGSTAASVAVPNTTCPTLPATTSRDNFTDMIGSAFWENKIQWASKLRSVIAVRGDEERFVGSSLAYQNNYLTSPSGTPYTVPDIVTLPDGTTESVNAANSGSASKFLPSPKASLIFGPWANTEFYLQGGFSFHSNDGRGSTQVFEPVCPTIRIPIRSSPKFLRWFSRGRGSWRAQCGRAASAKHIRALVSPQQLGVDAGWRHGRHDCFRTVEQPLWARIRQLLHANGAFGLRCRRCGFEGAVHAARPIRCDGMGV